MQEKFRTYLLAAAAAAMTVACGGGGDDAGTSNSATSQGSATTTDASCFVLPATGKTATVTATSTIPVQVEIATLTGLGTQTFEGQSYPALDERSCQQGLSAFRPLAIPTRRIAMPTPIRG